MKRKFFLSMLFMIVTTLAFSQSKEEKKQLKQEKAQKEYLEMKTLIESKAFVFKADRVHPTGRMANAMIPNMYSLNGDSYFLRVNEENVNAYLPYFGRVFSASTYGGDGAIEIDNDISNYQIKFNDDKRMAIITFNSQGKNERFELTLRVQRNGNADLTIKSANRNSIHFNGKVKEISVEL